MAFPQMVERLRVVGLQRQQSPNTDVNLENDTMLDFRNPNTHLPSFPHSQSRARSPHSPPSPASPFVPLSPVTPGTAPGSGHSTPFFTHSTRSGPGYVFSGSPFDIPSPAGGAAASFDALTLSSSVSVASSRFVTPKSVLLGLPPEGDAGGDSSSAGYGRGEKRRGSDDTDAAVVAATALAGLAGSGVSAKRVKQEERDAGWRDREVGMDVDS
ncbi:hypothetical protein A0H81_13568 [Grifola frondosa]|uniref:Uncharacterized protein n=1 Tax=Grifola frondosa TaxID=5627 RepID=A0A1C7LQS6_GRIFR|nr:hypothetical protein A0H81_13568 [Grifola frondosa]